MACFSLTVICLGPERLKGIHQISSPSHLSSSHLLLDPKSEFKARATVSRAGASMKQHVMTRRMINRTLALETAGRIVEGRSRKIRADLDVGVIDGESGEGSRLFSNLIKDKSVWDPSLPPKRLEGEVWSKQGVPTRNSGRPAARATSPASEASVMAVMIGTLAESLSVDGVKGLDIPYGRRQCVSVTVSDVRSSHGITYLSRPKAFLG